MNGWCSCRCYLKQAFNSSRYNVPLVVRTCSMQGQEGQGVFSMSTAAPPTSFHLPQQPSHTHTVPDIHDNTVLLWCFHGEAGNVEGAPSVFVHLLCGKGAPSVIHPCICVGVCVCVCAWASVCERERWRSKAAGAFVVVQEGWSLGTTRLRHGAPFRQESHSSTQPKILSVLDLIISSQWSLSWLVWTYICVVEKETKFWK